MAWNKAAIGSIAATGAIVVTMAFFSRSLAVAGVVGFIIAALCALAARRLQVNPVSRVRDAETPEHPGIRAIFSGIADPVVVIERAGNISMFNAQAKAALPQLAVGRALSLAIRSPEVIGVVERALRGQAISEADWHEKVPVERSYEVRATPLRLDGAPISDSSIATEVMIMFRDVTAGRRLERLRVDFVANASHELRTPLASLYGFIETMEGPARNDAAARTRFLAIMRDQAQRMSRLIDDLLSLSRIELKEHVRPTAEVRLDSIVHEVIDMLAPLARECGTTIQVDELESLSVIGDRDELVRVFENLIENAIKYGQSGQRVDVSLVETERAISATVRDYGPGIAPEHLPRLTERFYRADTGESRQRSGTGLGLALVKHILNRHGARLSVASELGEGASFTVLFPKPSTFQVSQAAV